VKNHYKITLCYNGANYFGWQIQNGSKLPTIQGEIERVLKKVSPQSDFKTLGASRTDAGVHALNQVFKLSCSLNIPTEGLHKLLNDNLASDLHILKVETCTEAFHPIYHCKDKTYYYLLSLEQLKNPFVFELVSFEKENLHLDIIKQGVQLFLGSHDFVNFYCKGSITKSTIREIYSFSVDFLAPDDLGPFFNFNLENIIIFKIKGSGFLKQMVRMIIGSLVALGTSRISLAELESLLQGKLAEKKWKLASGSGLYLMDINYCD
jgi:tRNA pseudouridine38-40 synthase